MRLLDKAKERLGVAGRVIYFIILMLVSVLPIAALSFPFYVDLILVGIMTFFPPISTIFWIWGLVVTIQGPQDWFAIVYYVACAVCFIPFIISFIGSFLPKRK